MSPIQNEQYAIMIAQDWNVPAPGIGYVTRFEVDRMFAPRYPGADGGDQRWMRLSGSREFSISWPDCQDPTAMSICGY